MRGRKPVPTHLKILKGNPGKRRLNQDEPMPDRGMPEKPLFLDTYAKAAWKSLTGILDRMGMLTVADGLTLTCLCQAWSELHHASVALKRKGRTVVNGAGGLSSHPAISQQRSAWKAIREFSALFGLDPSSRVRLKTPAKKPDDPFEEFLSGGKSRKKA